MINYFLLFALRTLKQDIYLRYVITMTVICEKTDDHQLLK